jgi:hypothetical protein
MSLKTEFNHKGIIYSEEELISELTGIIKGGMETGHIPSSITITSGWGEDPNNTGKYDHYWSVNVTMVERSNR